MVTMNSEKVGAKRKTDSSVSGCVEASSDDTAISSYQPSTNTEESPNNLLYKKVHR